MLFIYLLSYLFYRLEEIGLAASKEYSLEKTLEKMQEDWKDTIFVLIPYRESVSNILSHILVLKPSELLP